ncbi:hypothetical protein ACIBU0_20955 [Streptomyces sp. NPDC049627]|uniref:hypothetical protein n=1 Tax=Streptomyces sp. NPDC049627 TaxID=3365595 RepID=UPI0037951ECB
MPEARPYAIDCLDGVVEDGIRVGRPSVGGILDIPAELVTRLEAVVIGPRGGSFLCRAAERSHLPAGFQPDAVVIEMTGRAIEDAARGA